MDGDGSGVIMEFGSSCVWIFWLMVVSMVQCLAQHTPKDLKV